MKAAVIGGYGVFGGRLAQLLLRDGHEVWVAGRNVRKTEEWTARHGGRPLRLDRTGDLAPLAQLSPQVVIDAAGPFRTDGSEPWRLARFCIGHGIDYLDLSDDPAFTAGIRALDGEAQAAGRFALSGASSVPAISSAAVAALAEGLSGIDVIETAILPGNRAPRGRSVIAGILAQIGKPMREWRGGQWREIRSWSERRTYRLDRSMRRAGWAITVPDVALFPEFFAARSVMFRAGMELAVLNRALCLLAALRRAGLLRNGAWQTALGHRIAALLLPFGSDRGGMVVSVTGERQGGPVRRSWHLLAEAGEGPFVPGIAVRCLLRRAERIAPGARPCLAEITLAEIEAAMGDLAVETRRSEQARPALFQAALGEQWHALPPPVRRLHEIQDRESFSGRASVERGAGPIARLAAWLLRFPEAGSGIPVTVTMTRTARGELWERNFAGRRLRSHLARSRSGHYRERFGPLNCELALIVEKGAMSFPVRSGRLFGIPLPRPLLPVSETREYAVDGLFHFDVALHAPLGGGLIVRYRGTLSPDARLPVPSISPPR